MMNAKDHVFISYAREDQSWAERLYMDLRKQEINAWLDVRCLAAGANWKLEITKAIRSSRYFLLLLSRHSVNKRGFVQKEMKEAVNVLQEFPKGEIFLIPVRLDATEPIDDELRELNWVNLAPDYHSGFERILSSLVHLQPEPLVVTGKAGFSLPAKFIDKGREITVEMPLLIGPRAPVSYAPFRTRTEFLQQFFDRLPTGDIFTDRRLSYYVTLDTRHPNVLLGDDLKTRYPEYITLVLQNSFRDLQVRREGVSVRLAFATVERIIGFPFEAVVQIQIPEIGLAIVLEQPAEAIDAARPQLKPGSGKRRARRAPKTESQPSDGTLPSAA